MSIIEQAVRRLEELRRSGIDLPAQNRPVGPEAPGDAAAGRGLRQPGEDSGRPMAPERESRPRVIRSATSAGRPASSGKLSKKVDIDLSRLAAMGYLTPEAPRARIVDEFRAIKRPLLTNVHGRAADPVDRAQLIMVTSALPGEGKTFVSVNLAISLAMELDTSVLLIDADVSRPSVLNRLGLQPAPGLLDLLTEPSLDMADVLLRTNIEKLTLLPAGKPQGRATELLASDAMTQLLDELATRYSDRILVFDAPPLLPSTESPVLATHMGQVILVVEAERTTQKAVEQALATVESCPVVLPLLNKLKQSELSSYYGY